MGGYDNLYSYDFMPQMAIFRLAAERFATAVKKRFLQPCHITTTEKYLTVGFRYVTMRLLGNDAERRRQARDTAGVNAIGV